MVAVLLVDVGFGDLHSTKDPAMDLYIIQMSKLILQSAFVIQLHFLWGFVKKQYMVSENLCRVRGGGDLSLP